MDLIFKHSFKNALLHCELMYICNWFIQINQNHHHNWSNPIVTISLILFILDFCFLTTLCDYWKTVVVDIKWIKMNWYFIFVNQLRFYRLQNHNSGWNKNQKQFHLIHNWQKQKIKKTKNFGGWIFWFWLSLWNWTLKKWDFYWDFHIIEFCNRTIGICHEKIEIFDWKTHFDCDVTLILIDSKHELLIKKNNKNQTLFSTTITKWNTSSDVTSWMIHCNNKRNGKNH